MAELLREVFNPDSIKWLSSQIESQHEEFDSNGFFAAATKGLAELNYAERIELITDALYAYLPSDYLTAIGILIKSLPESIETSDDFKFSSRDFINLPACRYVSKFGLDHFEPSMNALKEMTSRFTSEYDIRYFIQSHTEESIKLISTWADSENFHVRRLASEGTRPRLPMGRRLKMFVEDPTPILPILEKLKNDPMLYVRRSVANSLNDISKDHPELAADIAKRWMDEGFEHCEWVCKHAMRTLYKTGNTKALAIADYPEPDGIEVWGIDIKNTTLMMGSDLEFSFVLDNTSTTDMNIMVDYEILFLKNNKKLSPKVFKLKKTIIKNGKKLKLEAKYPIRKRTTRKYYSGRHYVRIIVNGVRHAPVPFYLQAD